MANLDQVLILGFSDEKSPLPIDSNPLALALGAELVSVNCSAGNVELLFNPQPQFNQGGGTLQGGAVSAMLDFAMAFAGLAILPANCSLATINLNVSFLRPAVEGQLRATGTIDRRGRSTLFGRSELRAADGALLATASASMLSVDADFRDPKPASATLNGSNRA